MQRQQSSAEEQLREYYRLRFPHHERSNMEVPEQLPGEQQLTLWEFYHQPQVECEKPQQDEEVYGDTSIVPKQSAD